MLWPLPAAMAIIGAGLAILWMTNLYNFMDGMDGLAASMAVFGFGTYAALGWRAGDAPFAATCLATAGAAAGFLLHNRPPARIFMGDLGAVVLGFLAAAYTLHAVRAGLFPLWLGALVFAPFIADATATLARRAWRREAVWRAHRTHLYQRAALAFGTRRTLAGYVLWMAACAAAALGALHAPLAVQWAALAGAVGTGAAMPALAARALRQGTP
jgi:UDP-N-acetylmuramyl pentapeptide phosphotransferase/UDP-N-acetylglucosamine-1-phosphate transferase